MLLRNTAMLRQTLLDLSAHRTTITCRSVRPFSAFSWHLQHHEPAAHPSGPTTSHPHVTNPTPSKPHSEGHVVDKAQKALSNKDKPPAQQEHAHLENILNAQSPGEAAQAALDAGKSLAKEAGSKISGKTTDPHTDAASKGIKERAEQMKSSSENAASSVKERAKQALDQVLDGAGSLAQKAEERANQLKETAVDAGESIIQQAGERAEKAKKKLVESFTNQSQRAKTSSESIAQQTQEQLDRAKEMGESIAGQAKEKTANGIGSITEQVKNKAEQIKGKVMSTNEQEQNKDRPREAASSNNRQNFEELVEKIDTIEGYNKGTGGPKE